VFALKLFLHSPNRYYTSLEFHIGNTKSKSWVETYLIPSNVTKKEEERKQECSPFKMQRVFGNERGAQKHGYFKNSFNT
jgi:hypothetical protein